MKILVIFPDGKTKVMNLEDVCEKYKLSEKQILWAIKSGHHLKTMLFDEV